MFFWYLVFSIIFFIYKIESGKILSNFDQIFGEEWDENKSEEIVIKIEQKEQNDNSTAAIDQMGAEIGSGPNDQQKRKIILQFDAIKEKLKKRGNYQCKNRGKIERKIAKLLGTNRKLIQKWKNELNLNKNKIKKQFYEMKKSEFIERFGEFKELYAKGKQKEFVKELGISERTFWRWKKELLPNYHKTPNKPYNEDKVRKMKQYFEKKQIQK